LKNLVNYFFEKIFNFLKIVINHYLTYKLLTYSLLLYKKSLNHLILSQNFEKNIKNTDFPVFFMF